jgi:hypothetical protein
VSKMAGKTKFRIRNILKDGTVLKPGEMLPLSEGCLAAFGEVIKILDRIRENKNEASEHGSMLYGQASANTADGKQTAGTPSYHS